MRILTLIFVLLAGAPVLADGFAADNAGEWHGVGIQIDGQEWSFSLSIDADTAKIDYDSTECGGHLDYLKTTEDRIIAIEKLTFGLDVCLDGGLVKIDRYDENALLYQFFDRAGTVVAKAILIEGAYDEGRYQALRKLTLEKVGKGFVKGPEAEIFFGDDKT